MVYFKEVTDSKNPILIRYEEGKVCESYNYKKGIWEKDYKKFGKMCLGDIEAEEVTLKEIKKYFKD